MQSAAEPVQPPDEPAGRGRVQKNVPLGLFPVASAPRFAPEETRMSESDTFAPEGTFPLVQFIDNEPPSCADEPLEGEVTFKVAGSEETTATEAVPTATTVVPASVFVFSEVQIGGSVVQKPVVEPGHACGYAMQLFFT